MKQRCNILQCREHEYCLRLTSLLIYSLFDCFTCPYYAVLIVILSFTLILIIAYAHLSLPTPIYHIFSCFSCDVLRRKYENMHCFVFISLSLLTSILMKHRVQMMLMSTDEKFLINFHLHYKSICFFISIDLSLELAMIIL